MDMRNVVDVSSFLLIEETADNFLNCEMFHNVVITIDEDDAESCSWDTNEIVEAAGLHEVFDYDIDQDPREEFCGVVEEELMWLSAEGGLGYTSKEKEKEESNWVGINVSRKVKDEMEDGLFWETCMAVGYP